MLWAKWLVNVEGVPDLIESFWNHHGKIISAITMLNLNENFDEEQDISSNVSHKFLINCQEEKKYGNYTVEMQAIYGPGDQMKSMKNRWMSYASRSDTLRGTCAGVQLRIHNLNLIMRKQQTKTK